MPHALRRVLTIVALLVTVPSARAALTTQNIVSGLTPADLANAILGSGVSISNVSLRGCETGLGTFAGGTGIIGLEAGLVLSSGNIASAVGPNEFTNASTQCDAPGDVDLDALVPESNTQDAAVLEFDFVPTGSTVAFQYVFASEEYNEFVGSSFNDVFGFFVNGVNLALLPGTNSPVAVNNVNGTTNAVLYVPNRFGDVSADVPGQPGPLDTEADGLTQVLSFTAPVTAGQTNHLKLAIADTSDAIYDSWIFVGASSLSSTTAGVDIEEKGKTIVLDVDIGETGKGLGFIQGAGFALVPTASATIVTGGAITAPAGLTVVTKKPDKQRKFNKKGRAKLRLKLNPTGKQLLKAQGEVQALVIVNVTDKGGNSVNFQKLVKFRR
jgi:hypothetical protein